MAREPREFIDRPHSSVAGDFYDLQKWYDGTNGEYVKKRLERLIKKDPYFLDSYLLLFVILQDEGDFLEAERVLNNAYKKAIELITDEEGNWPDILEWVVLQNRHIIRTILNKAIWSWRSRNTGEALDLLRKLLKTNPRDNIGARNYILAIRMGMTFEEFEGRFNKSGYYDMELVDWFDENYKKFPDEFDWWDKAIEEYM